jgi:hypothetical protein
MIDELVRDALNAEAADVRGPNEADLLTRFAHRDRVVRTRRVVMACSGMAVAVIIALVASNTAPQSRVDISHQSSRSRRARPSQTHRHLRPATPHTPRLVAPPASETPGSRPVSVAPPVVTVPNSVVNVPASVVTVPQPQPTKTHDTTSATDPTPPTEPVTAPPAPPNFTLDSADNYGRMFMIQGTAPPGSTFTVSSEYEDLSNGPQTFTAYENHAWGGGFWVTTATPIGEPFDATFTCSCGGSITIQLTRKS